MNIHIYIYKQYIAKLVYTKNELRLQIRSSNRENGQKKKTFLRRRRQELNKCIKYLNVHKEKIIYIFTIYAKKCLEDIFSHFSKQQQAFWKTCVNCEPTSLAISILRAYLIKKNPINIYTYIFIG